MTVSPDPHSFDDPQAFDNPQVADHPQVFDERLVTAPAETPTPTTPAPAADDNPERLVPRDRADAYSSRWDSIKGDFVDEPRQAVQDADQLVSELLDELQELFRGQRQQLENDFASDAASTEELRVALRRYRAFFDQLLAI